MMKKNQNKDRRPLLQYRHQRPLVQSTVLLFVLPILSLISASADVGPPGSSFRFLNSGTVHRNDIYTLRKLPSIYNEGYMYMGAGSDAYNVVGSVDYLFRIDEGTDATPPTGMRSSVPLGPLGEGSLELRADGRLADWGTLFNNAPFSAKGWNRKIDVDDAMFALAVEGTKKASPFAKALRTHPPDPSHIPPVDELTYSGGFPAARLKVRDADLEQLGMEVSVTAFGEFAAGEPANSTAPIIFFVFRLQALKPVKARVLFVIPNVINGTFREFENGVTLSNNDTKLLPVTGNISLSVVDGSGIMAVPVVGANVTEVFRHFASAGLTTSKIPPSGQTEGGAGGIAMSVELAAGEEAYVVFALSWYFPHRIWGSTDLGHFYQQQWNSSEGVLKTEGTSERLKTVEQAGAAWQAVCLNNSFPDFLKDALVNSPAVWGKTSFHARDGRWRNFESHSCAQMEPPHIHLARALGYMLHMPSLERQTPELYARVITADGVVAERFGCACFGCGGDECTLDVPGSGSSVDPRADDNPAFILDLYMNYKWTLDGPAFLADSWPAARAALEFSLTRAERFGLTYQLVNTHDEHGLIGDINAYSSTIYLAALAAGVVLAEAVGDKTFAGMLSAGLERGRAAMAEYLWDDEDGFWRQAWCESTQGRLAGDKALESGVLYGFLWANVLGISDHLGIPNANVTSHLRVERSRNLTPYGLAFATNRSIDYYHGCPKGVGRNYSMSERSSESGTGFSDMDNWSSHPFTHAVMAIYTNATETSEALSVAQLGFDTYRIRLADQWDYRDTFTLYENVPTPSCNSHYGRQTIFWALPLALTGQQLDMPRKALSFEPDASIRASDWPVLLPFYSGLARLVTPASIDTIRNEAEGGTKFTSTCIHFKRLSGDEDTMSGLSIVLNLDGETIELGRINMLPEYIRACDED